MTDVERVSHDGKGGKISELRDQLYDVADVGTQADKYTKTTKAIGEYVGRVYSKEMKNLVLHLKEGAPVEPVYPDTTSATEKDKAVWSKLYDRYLKRLEVYDDYKAKVFTIIMGQCTKAMKNTVEGTVGFDKVEADHDVVGLLKTLKGIAYESNDKMYPYKQVAGAWKQLAGVQQQQDEELVNYYKHFTSILELVERSYGRVVPIEIAKKGFGGPKQYEAAIAELEKANYSTTPDKSA